MKIFYLHTRYLNSCLVRCHTICAFLYNQYGSQVHHIDILLPMQLYSGSSLIGIQTIHLSVKSVWEQRCPNKWYSTVVCPDWSAQVQYSIGYEPYDYYFIKSVDHFQVTFKCPGILTNKLSICLQEKLASQHYKISLTSCIGITNFATTHWGYKCYHRRSWNTLKCRTEIKNNCPTYVVWECMFQYYQ